MNTTERRRLERAGYAYVQSGRTAGWVPKAYAKQVVAQIEAWRVDVEAAAAAPARPRGRPRKETISN